MKYRFLLSGLIIFVMGFSACNHRADQDARAQLSPNETEAETAGDENTIGDIRNPQIKKDVEITSFEDCVKAGYPIMRSLPPQCRTNEGLVFVDKAQLPKIPLPGQRMCEDRCGDGSCDEMVCMAIGCPCPETQKSCPQDCK